METRTLFPCLSDEMTFLFNFLWTMQCFIRFLRLLPFLTATFVPFGSLSPDNADFSEIPAREPILPFLPSLLGYNHNLPSQSEVASGLNGRLRTALWTNSILQHC